MADDSIKVIASIQVENGEFFKFPKTGSGQLQFAQAAIGGGVPGSITVTTAEMDIDLSPLGTKGWVRLQNVDETNYVDWGPKSAGAMVPIGRMLPGEPALFRLNSAAILRMKANVASCKVQILAFEN